MRDRSHRREVKIKTRYKRSIYRESYCHLCPDTLYALNRLSEAKAEIDFKNLSASLADLKVYLSLRQDDPAYADVRANGGIGIPCFVLEDGTVTRNLETVLK